VLLAITTSCGRRGVIGGKIVIDCNKGDGVKLKIGLFFLSLLLCPMAAQVQAQTAVLFQKQLTVPGPNSAQTLQGIHASFSVTQISTITLNVTTNVAAPTLNVYILYPDDYAVYLATGSLAKATPLKNLTQLNTVSYKTQSVLNDGNFGLVIQWAQSGVFSTEPSVTVEIDAAPYAPAPLTTH
jgi:hypothetical protein